MTVRCLLNSQHNSCSLAQLAHAVLFEPQNKISDFSCTDRKQNHAFTLLILQVNDTMSYTLGIFGTECMHAKHRSLQECVL